MVAFDAEHISETPSSSCTTSRQRDGSCRAAGHQPSGWAGPDPTRRCRCRRRHPGRARVMTSGATIVDEIPIIDSDTHVIEPADLWTSRLSTERWGTLVPHVRWDDETAEEVWYFGDKKIYAAGLAAGADARVPPALRALADADPRTYDAHATRAHGQSASSRRLYPHSLCSRSTNPGMTRPPSCSTASGLQDFLVASAPRSDRYVPLCPCPSGSRCCVDRFPRGTDRYKGGCSRREWRTSPAACRADWDPFGPSQEISVINFHIVRGHPCSDQHSGKHLNYA